MTTRYVLVDLKEETARPLSDEAAENALRQPVSWLESFPVPAHTDTREGVASSVLALPQPLVSGAVLKQGTESAEQLHLLDHATKKAFSPGTIAATQALNPLFVNGRYICSQEAQADKTFISGPKYLRDGPATTDTEVFPGHWLYCIGYATTQEINDNVTVIACDPTKLAPGCYAVIYHGGEKFTSAEQVRVVSVNSVDNTCVIERGYKSQAAAHPVGSVIARHQIGNSETRDPLNWARNLSTVCPLDANGKRANECLARWIVDNIDKDKDGQESIARVDAWIDDSSFWNFQDGGERATRACSCMNKVAPEVPDFGIDQDGNNIWGAGLHDLYQMVRDGFDARGLTGVRIIGGDASCYVDTIDGVEQETALDGRYDATNPYPAFDRIDNAIAQIDYHLSNSGVGPKFVYLQSKVPSPLFHGETGYSDFSVQRLNGAFAAIRGCLYGHQNYWLPALHWLPWFSVAPEGKEVLSDDSEACASAKHWLGNRVGPPRRIYAPEDFCPENNVLPQDVLLASKWVGIKTDISCVGEVLLLAPSGPLVTRADYEVSVAGHSVPMQSDTDYVFYARVRSEVQRKILFTFGLTGVSSKTSSGRILRANEWTDVLWCFRTTTAAVGKLKINMGMSLSTVDIEAMHLYEGVVSPQVFVQEFDKGMVLANATPTKRKIPLSGGPWKRIKGSRDPIDDGCLVRSLNLGAYDGAFLVRQSI